MNFLVRGTIEDVDSTTLDDPVHPSMVILVDFGQAIRRVVLTPELASRHFADLVIGRRVRVCGHMAAGPVLFATELSISG